MIVFHEEVNMAEVKTHTAPKKPTLLLSLIPIVAVVLFLYIGIAKLEQDAHIPLVGSSIVAVLVAVFGLGYKWSDLEDGILKTINMGMQAVIILMIIGMLIGSWIIGGVVPSMIYYGLQVLSPKVFLVAAMILCSIVSLSSGSSWTTAGTVGVALIGVAAGLGIPAPIAAGAIISGAYFGDKMSPLSDTTNLAPAMAGANLFDHIKHMAYTTGPSYIIVLIIFGIITMRFSGENADTSSIGEMLAVLQNNFNISLLMILPPILVIGMVVLRVPAIPGLIGGTILGMFFALVFQGADFASVLDVLQNGYAFELSETATEAEEMIGSLLSKGGMQSMLWTVSLIICALTFGGLLEVTGMLEVIAGTLLKFAKGTGSLVLVTILSSVFINVVAADQYLSLVIPGRMYKDEYARRGLSPRNLSRTLEDGGTITSALVPWNTCGAYMATALGVPTVEYLPYAFLNILNPLIAILWAYLGLFQMKMTPEEAAAYEKAQAALHEHN